MPPSSVAKISWVETRGLGFEPHSHGWGGEGWVTGLPLGYNSKINK